MPRCALVPVAWLCLVFATTASRADADEPAGHSSGGAGAADGATTGGPSPAMRDVRFALSLSDPDDRLASCGARVALELAVEERLHRRVFAIEEEADVLIDVTLDPNVAHIRDRDRGGSELGRRDVGIPSSAASCTKTVETLAVVLAILVGPPRQIPAETSTPDGPSSTPANPSSTPARPARPATGPFKEGPERPSAKPRRVWTVAPVIEAVGGGGILPGVAWGFQAGAVIRPPAPRLSMIARGEYWLPADTGTRPNASFDRLSGSLLGCVGLTGTARLNLAGCGGGTVGVFRSSSDAFTRASNTGLVLDVLAEVRVGYGFRVGDSASSLDPPSRYLIEPVLALQAALLLQRDRFRYRDFAGRDLTLLQPAPVAVQGSFGVVVHFL